MRGGEIKLALVNAARVCFPSITYFSSMRIPVILRPAFDCISKGVIPSTLSEVVYFVTVKFVKTC